MMTSQVCDNPVNYGRITIRHGQVYLAPYDGRTGVAQMYSAHQRFSGVLVPTLCRLLRLESDGTPIAKPPLLDIEIFDAVFE
jgi:hypothetical protein